MTQTTDRTSRFIRHFPGRLRIEVCGLKDNATMAQSLSAQISKQKGIVKVHPNNHTGRMLIVYEQNQISLRDICQTIEAVEQSVPADQRRVPDFNWQAITSLEDSHGPITLGRIKARSKEVPLPLIVAIGAVAFFSVKQLFFGGSVLAYNPVAFYIAAGVSVVTGYSFFRRGLQQLAGGKTNVTDFN